MFNKWCASFLGNRFIDARGLINSIESGSNKPNPFSVSDVLHYAALTDLVWCLGKDVELDCIDS